MAEQLTLHQGGNSEPQSTATNGRSAPDEMDGARHEFLAGAAFPYDQHRVRVSLRREIIRNTSWILAEVPMMPPRFSSASTRSRKNWFSLPGAPFPPCVAADMRICGYYRQRRLGVPWAESGPLWGIRRHDPTRSRTARWSPPGSRESTEPADDATAQGGVGELSTASRSGRPG